MIFEIQDTLLKIFAKRSINYVTYIARTPKHVIKLVLFRYLKI